ncbi:MAG: glycosyltransferase [Dokdonella sp.]|uniref:glycosyltransferase n=1 Tax=Dokdonella sp. TaxID=2291710 RepID=UPI0025C01B3D|nr:glycosyltransferase [Dokdonella sp.]MBZ0224256.1 glycosyltransferase [Dokdonella sp.]
MHRPAITVCIITYNQVEWIERCVRSAIEQEVDAELCVLVGDDASDDGTSEIVAQMSSLYPRQITHLRRNSRMGAFDNSRDLLARSEGDFVACVDGDDYWLPGKLKRQLSFMQSHPDCVATYTNAVAVDAVGKQIGVFNDVDNARFDLAALLRRGNFLNNSSVLFRRHALTGALRAGTPIIDYYSHLWLARGGWLGHIGEPLAAYRVNVRGSMLKDANVQVRELYWQAIQSVPRDRVSDDDYAHGIADFLRRVFFRAVRTRDMSLYRTWATRVYAASPYGRVHTSALVAASIIRIGGKALWGQRARLVGRSPPRILYRR